MELLIQQLLSLSSFLQRLYLQSHLVHLNYEAPNFLGVHAFLKEQYDSHVEQFDLVSEHIRTLDHFVPLTREELDGVCSCPFTELRSYDCCEMLMVYLQNLESMGMQAKAVGQCARECEAPDIENDMATLVGQVFKAAWFIKATLRSHQ